MNHYELDLNPQPWTPGTAVTRAGRGGKGRFTTMIKDPQLETYQEAVREAMYKKYPDIVRFPKGVDLAVEFYFWRQLERASDAEGKKHRGKRADATNLQKALEDALQGVLYDNDSSIVDIRTTIVDQAQDTSPCIVINIEELT
jgi:Holliday junction resolvase RusA-like endonuclease